jgi:excinuclease ABC subunit A
MLLKVLHRLRDHGNTIVVIEHNLDVIKTADWIVDLGPKAATAAATGGTGQGQPHGTLSGALPCPLADCGGA